MHPPSKCLQDPVWYTGTHCTFTWQNEWPAINLMYTACTLQKCRGFTAFILQSMQCSCSLHCTGHAAYVQSYTACTLQLHSMYTPLQSGYAMHRERLHTKGKDPTAKLTCFTLTSEEVSWYVFACWKRPLIALSWLYSCFSLQNKMSLLSPMIYEKSYLALYTMW